MGGLLSQTQGVILIGALIAGSIQIALLATQEDAGGILLEIIVPIKLL